MVQAEFTLCSHLWEVEDFSVTRPQVPSMQIGLVQSLCGKALQGVLWIHQVWISLTVAGAPPPPPPPPPPTMDHRKSQFDVNNENFSEYHLYEYYDFDISFDNLVIPLSLGSGAEWSFSSCYSYSSPSSSCALPVVGHLVTGHALARYGTVSTGKAFPRNAIPMRRGDDGLRFHCLVAIGAGIANRWIVHSGRGRCPVASGSSHTLTPVRVEVALIGEQETLIHKQDKHTSLGSDWSRAVTIVRPQV
uniref:melanocortin-2 receptor accessory protein 2 isoform X3 n=2 Tax=Myxine glutinosa TaxID=7769 RepID=UPI00358E9961